MRASRQLTLLWGSVLVMGLAGACSHSAPPAAAEEAAGPQAAAAAPQAASLSGEILETMNAGGYTYVRVNSAAGEIWAAGPETEVKVGETVTVDAGMPMRNFHSQTLNRTFDVVYFVGSLRGGAATTAAATGGQGAAPQATEMPRAIPEHGRAIQGGTSSPAVDLSNIQKAAGGWTVAEVWEGKDRLADQEVLVRGRVVKYNAGIMGRNWLHIRDGSGSDGSNDLTVTTDDTAQVGNLVSVRGTLKRNQDFGFGYAYDVLVEQAKLTVE